MCYYQTPFNIALILEQISNYNNVLKEQANKEKSARIKNNMISEEHMIRLRMSPTAKEHTPNVSNDKNVNNERKSINEYKWVKPKKCMPINCFYKTHENK